MGSNSYMETNSLNNTEVATVPITDVEIPLTETVPIVVEPTIIPEQKPLEKKENVELPPWLNKMVKRQDFLNRKYEYAHDLFAKAYNDFLSAIEDINSENDTHFTFHQAASEFKGYMAPEIFEDEED